MTWTTRPRSKSGNLAYISEGSGPLVVFIHGVGLRSEAWGAQIDALAQHCTVMAIDMPGHGHSGPIAANPQLADYTNLIADSFEGAAVVVGHSFGAMIALDMAIRRPKKVSGVAALNAIFRRSPEAQLTSTARADSLDGVTFADPSQTLTRWFGENSTPERDACRDWLLSVDPAGYRETYRVLSRENGPSDAGLRSLSCPALFMTGEEEPNSTPAMSRNMAALVQGGRAEIVADAAHMMPMTHAAEVNAALSDLIETSVR